MQINAQSSPDMLDPKTKTELITASEDAYRSLADKGYNPEEVHRLGVCYQATALMVNSLIDNGHIAEHEIRSGWTVTEHSYVTLDTGLENEIIIDPTWQQFLPKGKDTADIPKVLIGTRSSVIELARSYGVDEMTTQLWQKQGVKMTVQQQKRADHEAEQEARHAEGHGAWEKFMANSQ